MSLLSRSTCRSCPRLYVGLVAFGMALALLLPGVRTASIDFDEDQYIWSAAYFGGKVVRLDFSPEAQDHLIDPGWSPGAWWSLTQPMGTRLLLAPALGLTGAPAPHDPYLFDPARPDPVSDVDPETRVVARVAAILAAALGLGLIAGRLGMAGLAVTLVFLAVPDVRADLSRAWAEGPLLLGFGLATLAYGTRWFPAAYGLAATFKLTALGLWPLALVPAASGRMRPVLALAATIFTWSALTPPSWFAFGPFYLVFMTIGRVLEYGNQSALSGAAYGLYWPTRYGWPPLLGLLMLPPPSCPGWRGAGRPSPVRRCRRAPPPRSGSCGSSR
jgi:hypothetical protein